jgi:translation initiation factor IF-1
MAGEDAIRVEGIVVEALPNKTYRVKLRNGHQLTGFLTGKAKRDGLRLAAGDTVRLQVSPYDLSEGRILIEEK